MTNSRHSFHQFSRLEMDSSRHHNMNFIPQVFPWMALLRPPYQRGRCNSYSWHISVEKKSRKSKQCVGTRLWIKEWSMKCFAAYIAYITLCSILQCSSEFLIFVAATSLSQCAQIIFSNIIWPLLFLSNFGTHPDTVSSLKPFIVTFYSSNQRREIWQKTIILTLTFIVQ